MPPRIGVVVVNYNNYSDTVACLEALSNCGHEGLVTILVDNASTDGSGLRLAALFERNVCVLHAETNGGFAKGNNLGIRRALDLQCEYVVLLNNDTVVARTFLAPIVACMKERPDIAAASGKILYHGEPTKIWYAGSQRSWRGTVHRGYGAIDSRQFDAPCTVDFVTGCFLVVRSRVIREIGMLDESFFMGVEDHEFSYRIRNAGYHLAYIPASVIWHKVGRSRSKITAGQIFQGYLAHLIFKRKTLPLNAWRLYHAVFLIWACGLSVPRISYHTGLPVIRLIKATYSAWRASQTRVATTRQDWVRTF